MESNLLLAGFCSPRVKTNLSAHQRLKKTIIEVFVYTVIFLSFAAANSFMFPLICLQLKHGYMNCDNSTIRIF